MNNDPICVAAGSLMYVMECWPRKAVMPTSTKERLEEVEAAIKTLLDEARHEGVSYDQPPKPPPQRPTLRLVK